MKIEGEKMHIKKTPEVLAEEKRMRDDAKNQFRLAIALYSRFHGMGDSEGDDFGNAVLNFWTAQNENGESYSKKYREFVNSDRFKNNSKFQGNISFVELEDFI